MEKFDRVLNKEDEQAIIDELGLADILAAVARKIIQKAEQAAIAKYKAELAEQEPVAWVSSESFSSDGTSDIMSKNLKVGTKLYAHPMPSCQGILDSSNHIAHVRNMVADMYWINPDYPSYTSILDAFDPVQSAVEVEIGDQFEVSRAKTLPDLTIDVTELEENGDVKDYKILSGDHFADASNMVFDPDAALTLAERTLNVEITERLADELIQFARKLHEKYAQADHIPDASNMIWCACGQGCDAEDKSSVVAESQAKIIAASHRYADMRVAAALWLANEKDAAESYKALELRIAEELAIMREIASNDQDIFRLRQKEKGQREAISEWLELIDKIKKSGRPPHADYWNQSIYEAEKKLRLSIQD